MKKKNLTELKTKSIQQLNEILSGMEKDIVTGRVERAQSKVKNVHAINQIRKDIAKIKTILQEKIFLTQKETKNVAS